MRTIYELTSPTPIPKTTAELISEARLFWTPKKIHETPPIPLRIQTKTPQLVEQTQRNRLGLENDSAPAPLLRALPVLPKHTKDAAMSLSAAATKKVPRAEQAQSPYSFVGKALLRFPRGNAVGSAWVIGKRAILTAGHCVYDQRLGGWANVTFMPQYADGAPIGTWTSTRITTLREFHQFGNLDFDIGACILDRDIGDETGISGYLVSAPVKRGENCLAVGYPARPQDGFAFDGTDLWQSIGKIASDEFPGTTRDRTYGMYNDMSSGCSGGPWFTVAEPYLACGLNSHILVDSAGEPADIPRQMRSPYFGAAFLRILQWVKANGGEPNEPGEIADDNGTTPIDNWQPIRTEIKQGLTQVVEQLQTIVAKV